MNGVRIFEKRDFDKIKDFQKEKPNAVMGVVYAIEYSGGYIKIGMSSLPADRASVLKHCISDYMQKTVYRIMISRWHTNYRENEKHLHKAFKECRVPNTELFYVSIEEIVEFISNGGILFEDKSQEILEKTQRTSDAIVRFGKSVIQGDYDERKIDTEKFDFARMYDDMLKSSECMTDEIIYTARNLIDEYRAAMEDRMDMELTMIKAWFVDRWMKYGLVEEKAQGANTIQIQEV